VRREKATALGRYCRGECFAALKSSLIPDSLRADSPQNIISNIHANHHKIENISRRVGISVSCTSKLALSLLY
jgi:hypothetical protein